MELHNLKWHEQMADAVAKEAKLAFDVELCDSERVRLRDAIYSTISAAKRREETPK